MDLWIFHDLGHVLVHSCPFRRWDERARGNMMVCLPFIGAVVGGIWALTAWILERLHAPNAVAALALAALPWLTTGWIHLDGYMDVCDAVLSRRDLDTRRKNSQGLSLRRLCRNFLVLLALAQWSFFLSADRVALLPLALIPVATRACAGLAVVSLRPIETSQYASMDRQGRAAKQAALWVMLLLSVGLPLLRVDGAGCAPWRRQPGTAWQSGTASGSCKECRAISPALR